MDEHAVTRKQFSAAILVSLLSPFMRLLPQAAVKTAGRGAWLSALPAALPLLALAYLLASFRRHMRPGEGMGGLLRRWLGPVLGRLVLCVFAAWFLFYAGFILRSGAERLTATIYPSSEPLLFIFIMLFLCLLVALGTFRAAARTAVIIQGVLLGALAVVLIFSAPNMTPERLLPIGFQDVVPIIMGAWPIATVGAVAASFSFLSGYAQPAGGKIRWIMGTILVILGLAALICGEVVSVFGPELTGQLMYPFFVMIRNISLLGLVPRIEAVVIAVWVFADFMLCAMLLRCAHEALRPIFGLPVPDDRPLFSLQKGRWVIWLEAAAVFGCSRIFDLTPWELLRWSDELIPLISDIFIFGGFTLLWLVTLPRRRTIDKSKGQ